MATLRTHLMGIDPITLGFKHDLYRKYRIVYNYAKHEGNFKRYSRINYKDVLIIFLLQNSFQDFIDFLNSSRLKLELETLVPNSNFTNEINTLNSLRNKFEVLSEKFKSIKIQDIKDNNNWIELYEFYFGNADFILFCEDIHTCLRKSSRVKRNKLLQIISTNLRRSGNAYSFSDAKADNIFTIVELINYIIKSHRKSEETTQIVIDDLRSPIEIMYFKQRYAAFYTIAVNRDDLARRDALYKKYMSPDYFDKAELLFEEERKGGGNHEFYKANISACIQQADIHISFLTKEEVDEKNLDIQKTNTSNEGLENMDNTSPYFSWKMQLLKYTSLISHPGLITPSPEERCMQMAYTAKHNSGCISRHVGAAITDGNYSIKAIGWNNTPAGQVPCVLRNAEDLLYRKNDIKSFTYFEKTDTKFDQALKKNFKSKIEEHGGNLKGRHACFCFKDVKNSFSDGKNPVQTRSLHAEENAFLQLAKYGGAGIENGKLFTTASPCELCAKKAYQLGIKVIYYIDPYKSISNSHILSAGSKPITPRLFDGAIGNAYHWLYDPIMPYKDEMALLLGNKFDDYATQQEDRASKLEKDLIAEREKNLKLEQRNRELEESRR